MGILGALLCDLVGVLQQAQFAHALTVDGSAALLAGTFHALVLGQGLHTLCVNLARLGVEVGLFLAYSAKPRTIGGEAALFFSERDLLAGQPRLPRLARPSVPAVP